jgi:hypothetical protein
MSSDIARTVFVALSKYLIVIYTKRRVTVHLNLDSFCDLYAAYSNTEIVILYHIVQ